MNMNICESFTAWAASDTLEAQLANQGHVLVPGHRLETKVNRRSASSVARSGVGRRFLAIILRRTGDFFVRICADHQCEARIF